MVGSPSRAVGGDDDRFGFDETEDWVRETIGRLVPQAVARRAVSVSVSLDREVVRPGETVTLTVTFRNRLPVPVSVVTPRRRLWGWAVDGERSAGAVDGVTGRSQNAFVFRARETKTVTRRWQGRFREHGESGTEWVDAAAGEHEVTAFLATREGRPRASATVRVEN